MQHHYLNIALKACRKASYIINQNLDNFEKIKIASKGTNNFVTNIDTQVDNILVKEIQKAYPDHNFYTEEQGDIKGDSDVTWIIDPIDGTTNIVHKGYPCYTISIAVMVGDQIEHAMVFNPITDDSYTASLGMGARLNGKRIRVSNTSKLESSLITAALPYYKREGKEFEKYFSTFKNLFQQTSDIRRTGSVALDLAHVAEGKLDACFEIDLQPYDVAAGYLLVKEAGGFVADPFSDAVSILDSGAILAGNPKIFAQVRKVINEQ